MMRINLPSRHKAFEHITAIWHKVFIEHCERNRCGHGGTYMSHFWLNSKRAVLYFWAGFVTIVHAICPILFTKQVALIREVKGTLNDVQRELFSGHPDLNRMKTLRDKDAK